MMRFMGLRWIVTFASALAAGSAFAGAPTAVGITNPANLSLTSPAIGAPGATQTLTLTFTSNGTTGYGASLNSLAIAGINAGDFAIVGGTCAAGSTVLDSGNQTCTVIVQYTASTAAPATAQLNASCTTVALIGGFAVTCNGTTGQISSLAGTLLAALVSTPMLDPKMLTALCSLLLAIGVYFASRNRT